MARIVWTQEAIRWLDEIYSYIANDNPDASSRVVSGIYDKVILGWAVVMKQLPIEKSVFLSLATTVSRT